MVDHTYREDAVASSVAAQGAAEQAAKHARRSASFAVLAFACLLCGSLVLVVFLVRRIQPIEARLGQVDRADDTGSLQSLDNRIRKLEGHGPGEPAPRPFAEIARSWAAEPCDPKCGGQGDVTLNGISMGEETCRVDRLERLVARLEASCPAR